MMSKKDFERAAKIVHAKVDEAGGDKKSYEYHVAMEMCMSYVKLFKTDNQRFNTDRFIKACGLA